jgi:hypothetical protein
VKAPNAQSLKNAGWYFLGIVTVSLIIAVVGLLVAGAAWVARVVFPWTSVIAEIMFCVSLFIFTPLAIPRKTRPWAGLGIFYSSFVFGLDCWLFCFLITYVTLGAFWTVVGLLFVGLGVVPLAIIGGALHGLWSYVGGVFILFILTFASRSIGYRLAAGRPPSTNDYPYDP